MLFGSGSRVQIITLKMTGFPGGSAGKEFAMRETWVRSLGWEDPLEKGKAPHSSIHSGLENSMDYKSQTRLTDLRTIGLGKAEGLFG